MGCCVEPPGNEVKIHATNSAGASLFKLSRPAEALHFFDKALLAHKRNPAVDPKTMQQTSLNRAAALVKLGRSSESIETYTQAIGAAPHDVASRLSRANAWKEIGGLEGGLQAATDYIAALEQMADQGVDEVSTRQISVLPLVACLGQLSPSRIALTIALSSIAGTGGARGCEGRNNREGSRHL